MYSASVRESQFISLVDGAGWTDPLGNDLWEEFEPISKPGYLCFGPMPLLVGQGLLSVQTMVNASLQEWMVPPASKELVVNSLLKRALDEMNYLDPF